MLFTCWSHVGHMTAHLQVSAVMLDTCCSHVVHMLVTCWSHDSPFTGISSNLALESSVTSLRVLLEDLSLYLAPGSEDEAPVTGQ